MILRYARSGHRGPLDLRSDFFSTTTSTTTTTTTTTTPAPIARLSDSAFVQVSQFLLDPPVSTLLQFICRNTI